MVVEQTECCEATEGARERSDCRRYCGREADEKLSWLPLTLKEGESKEEK